MLTALPEHIDPWKLARHGELLEGELPQAGLSRLRESVCADGGEPVSVRLQFGIDAEGHAFIEGDINTEVRLTCQRCLQSMPYALRAAVSLGLLQSGQFEAAAGREALEVTATPLSLSELVEDELILALPVITRHESCPNNEYMQQEADAAPDAAADNPFAVLQQLKR